MHIAFKPDLVDAKLFIFGLISFAPAPPPGVCCSSVHFVLFLAMVLLLPSHLVTAPLVMYEAGSGTSS